MTWWRLELRRVAASAAMSLPLAVLSVPAGAASGDRMLKSLFFGTTEIGDIAWIKVNTEEAAKEADFVHDLSSRRCAELGDRKWLWFVANHRKPDRDGATAFFLITVRALHPSGERWSRVPLQERKLV